MHLSGTWTCLSQKRLWWILNVLWQVNIVHVELESILGFSSLDDQFDLPRGEGVFMMIKFKGMSEFMIMTEVDGVRRHGLILEDQVSRFYDTIRESGLYFQISSELSWSIASQWFRGDHRHAFFSLTDHQLKKLQMSQTDLNAIPDELCHKLSRLLFKL